MAAFLVGGVPPIRAAQVVAWGDNLYGQTDVPPGLSNVVAVAAGLYHSLALRADGTVIAWGWNLHGQTDVLVGLSNVVAIAGGGTHSLALRVDGTVVAWGGNEEDQRNVPVGLSNVVSIVGGSHHSLALKKDGTVVAWGGPHRSAPGVLAGMSNVVALAASLGTGSPLAWVRADGTAGGTSGDYCDPDEAVDCLTNVVAVAEGDFHSLALRADGTVLASPGGVSLDLTNAVAVAAESESRLVLRSDGTVVVWGVNNQTSVRPGLNNVVAIAAGWLHGLALVGQGPPVLSVSLAQRTVSTSANALFHAQATGAWPLSYQWQYDRVDLPGATGPSLVLTNVQPRQAGRYSVTVGNDWGVVTNSGSEIVVLPLMIREPPTPQVSYPGGNATFTVRAVGNEPLAYQWRFNGVDLAGATNEVLVLNNLQFRHVGEYSAVVSNPLGSVVSDGARLDLSMVVAWDCDAAEGLSAGVTNVVAVAAGKERSAIARADGTVIGWGDNRMPPAGLSNAVAVAAAEDFGLALTANGQVVGWGDEYDLDDYPIPPGLSNVVAIAAGQIGLGLRMDGTVAAWGEYNSPNLGGFPRAPAWLSNVVDVAAGVSHGLAGSQNLALRANGTVVPFGHDGFDPQTIVEGLSNVVAIAAGFHANLALRGDGTVAAWATRSEDAVPEVPAGLNDAVAIAAGDSEYFALRADGTLVAWGSSECGDTQMPVSVPAGLRNVVAIGAGSPNLALIGHGPPILRPFLARRVVGQGANAVFYALASGECPLHYQWQFQGTNLPGANRPFLVLTNADLSQQGHYSLTVSNGWGVVKGAEADLTVRPVLITRQPVGRTTWLSQSAALAVEAEGAAPLTYQWRHNGVDLTGATNHTLELSRLQFHQSGEYSVVVANALGSASSVSVWLEVSAVVPWGYSFFGASSVPRGLSNVTSVAAGRYHCLALRADGAVAQWGMLSQQQVPARLTNVVAIAAGDLCSFALSVNGTVAAWGSYYEGGTDLPVRLPPGLSNVVAITAGSSYGLALRVDGTVVEWSYNGQVRTGVPAGLSDVIAIAAGGAHSLALRTDGRVVAWGNNLAGQTNVPPDLGDVVAIAAGNEDNLALRADGTVVGWGGNWLGWMDVPEGLSHVIAIAIAGVQSLALRADGSVVAWGQYYDRFGMTPMLVPTGLSNVVAIAAAATYNLAVVRARPALEILPLDSGTLLLQWDCSVGNWGLEETAHLGSINWVNVTNNPVNDGTRFSVPIQVFEGARYFRLRSW